MINKTLLILAPDYPSEHNEFNGCNALKNQIYYSKNLFEKIIVIAPVLLTYGLTPQDKFCKNYSYDNVEVYFPKCFFFPRIIKIPFISNYIKVSIDNRLSATVNTITKYNLSFDLIHARFTYPSMYIASELKKQYDVPLLATIHEDSGWFEEERIMNHPRFIQAWKSADILTRENTTDLPLLHQYNKNVACATAGYDSLTYTLIDKSTIRKKLNLNQNDKILFTFGLLDKRKGFQDLILAMSHLPPEYHDVKCYISGSGSYSSNLFNLITQLKLNNRIFLINQLNDKEVMEWINAADLFIFPSLKESFGIIQIEALGCGTPVIASTNVGSTDVINNACGYLFETGNPIDLSSKIIKGLKTVWSREEIHQYAENKYSWKVVSKQYDELYKKLLRE